MNFVDILMSDISDQESQTCRIAVLVCFVLTERIKSMYVVNANGTSRWAAPKGYSSWIEYWMAHKGPVSYCSASRCRGTDLVGAHVRKAYSLDQHLYIVPLCSSCNKRTDIFEVPDSMLLPVPSNL